MKKHMMFGMTMFAVLSMAVSVFADEPVTPVAPVSQDQVTTTEHAPNLGVSREVHERNRIRKAAHRAQKLEEKRERMEKKAERKAAKAQQKANRRNGAVK